MPEESLFAPHTSLLFLELSYPSPETLQLGFSSLFSSWILLELLRLGFVRRAISRLGRPSRKICRAVLVITRGISYFRKLMMGTAEPVCQDLTCLRLLVVATASVPSRPRAV